MENQDNSPQSILPQKKTNTAPKGVKILAAFNIVFPGVLAFFVGTMGLMRTEKITENFNQLVQERGITADPVTVQQLKMMLFPQLFVALFFIVTGVYLLKKEEWARKALVYFSLFTAILLCFSALMSPSAIGLVVFYVLHPGVCIWYLTSKTTREWFAGDNTTQPQDEQCCI